MPILSEFTRDVAFARWRLELCGAEGQHGSVAVENILMVISLPAYAQVQTTGRYSQQLL